MLDGAEMFTVTDLRQYGYCPRILYYQACLPDIRPVTGKMQAGIDAHDAERKRAVRRDMSQYGRVEGRRHFDVRVQSTALRLSGIIDEVVESAGELMPVDYKLAGEAGDHHRLQLAAYGLMLEETMRKPVRHGYLYLIPARQAVKVPLTSRLKARVREALAAMWQIAITEAVPAPTNWRQRCTDCEFRRFCNDV